MNPLETSHLTLLVTDRCAKLSATAEGKLCFNLWRDPIDNSHYLALADNEGGGYFSHELIPVTRIIDSLSILQASQQAFPAVRLRTVFEGKSANNASFMAAVLRHLHVLLPDSDNPKLHRVCDDLGTWPDRLSALNPNQNEDIAESAQSATPTPKPSKSRGKNTVKETIADGKEQNDESDS